jgi:hypothetical protein
VTVVAYVPDLMDRSRVSAAVADVTFVPTPEALPEAAVGAAVVAVDLARPGVLDVLPALVASGTRVVAFGSHVDRETLDAARAAGCTEVLPRSVFFRDLHSLLL